MMRYLQLLIFVFFTFLTSSGKGEDFSQSINRWLPQQKLEETINQYLATHNLLPFIDFNQGQFGVSFINPFFEDDHSFVTFMIGEFDSVTKLTKAVFMIIRDKSAEEIFVRTLYIMEGECMSPTLFMDVLQFPGFFAFHAKALELLNDPDSLVYISNEFLRDGSLRQLWTFCTSYETYEVRINLEPDGQGGTFFSVLNPEEY